MKSTNATQQFIPSPLDNTRLAHLCGPLDENLRQISAALDVTLFRRGEKFIADGDNAAVAVAMLEKFYAKAEQAISVEEIQLALVEQKAANAPKADGNGNTISLPRSVTYLGLLTILPIKE